MKKFKKTKKLVAFLMAFAMLFTNVATLYAAQEVSFPLVTNVGMYVADADTLYYTVISQEQTGNKLITATVYIRNGSPTETLTMVNAGFVMQFTDKIAPATAAGVPYYGGAKTYSDDTFEYGSVIPGCKLSSISAQVVQNDNTRRITGGMLSGTTGNYLILAPGETQAIFKMFFVPVISSDVINISMFNFTYLNVLMRRLTTYMGAGNYFVLADSRFATGDMDRYVLSPSSFKLHMEQQPPSGLSANNDTRQIVGYNASTMEWSENAAGPYTAAAPTPAQIGDSTKTIYVRMRETPYANGTSGTDNMYGAYKKLLASDPVQVKFTPKGPIGEVVKTSQNLTSTDGYTYVGDRILYTITAKNAGPIDSVWFNVVVTDVIPSNLTYVADSVKINGVSAVAPNAYYTAATRTLTANLGNINDGVTKTVTFEATVNSNTYGQGVANSVHVTGKNGDNTGDDVIVDETDETPFDVAEKTANPTIDAITEGDLVITGTGITGAEILITLPGGGTATVTVGAGGIWSYGPVAPVKNQIFKAKQKETGKDWSDEVQTTVQPRPASDLVIDKTSVNGTPTDGKLHVGDRIDYTLVVSNNAADDRALLTDVVVTDALPAYVTYVPGSAVITPSTGASVGVAGQTLTFTLPNLKGGQSVTITFSATVDDNAYGKDITNTASVAAKDDGTPVTDDDNDGDGDDMTVVDRSAAPVINPMTDGDEEVTGTGVPGATITVTFPDGTEGTTTVQPDGSWSISTPAPLNDGDAVTAVQKEAGKDPSAPVTEIVGGRPAGSVAIDKTSENIDSVDGKNHVGDTMEYTIVVTNEGPAKSILTGVVVTDELPDGITLVGGSVKINGVSAGPAFDDASLRILVINLPNIIKGETVTVTFQAKIDDNAYGKDIKNTAKVETSNDGSDEDDDDDDPNYPPIVVEQSDPPTIDKLTAGATIITGTGVAGSTIYVSLNGTAIGTATVQADGTWSIVSPALAIGDAVDAYQVTPGKDPSITVTKTVDDRYDGVVKIDKTSVDQTSTDGKIRVGDRINYTIVVSDVGTYASSKLEDVVVTDVLPDGITLVADSVKINGSPAGTALSMSTVNEGGVDRVQLVITFDEIIDHATKTITFQATVNADAHGKDITNLAKVETSNDGNDQDDDDDGPVPPIVVEKTPAPTIDDVFVGDTVITGTGIPGALITVSILNGKVVGTLDPVRVGADGKWSADSSDYNLKVGQRVQAVQLDDTDPTKEYDPSDPVETPVQAYPPIPDPQNDLAVIKTFENLTNNDGSFRAGDVILYTIKVQNNAPNYRSIWVNPLLVDIIPANLVFDRDSVQLDGQDPTMISYNVAARRMQVYVGDIAGAGGEKVVTFTATIAPAAAGTHITNGVTVSGRDKATNTLLTKTADDGGYDVYAKSSNPIVDDVTREDKVVTGTGEPGAEITVTWPDGSESTTTVNPDGSWTVDVPNGVTLNEGDKIIVVQKEDGKDKSDEVEKIVKDKTYRSVTGIVSSMAVPGADWSEWMTQEEIEAFKEAFTITVELRPTFWTPASPGMTTTAVWTGEGNFGRFTIDDVPFGSYILVITTPGYLTRVLAITISASDPDMTVLTPPDGSVFNLMWGDTDGSFFVDGVDTGLVLGRLNFTFGDPNYLPSCDVNRDGIIDGIDTGMVLGSINKSVYDYAGAFEWIFES